MQKNFDKQIKEHKLFYENFLKLSLYTLISVFVLLAFLAVFVV